MRGAVEQVAAKYPLPLTAQDKSCIILFDVFRNVQWSFGKDGQPQTKPITNQSQQSAAILYQRGIEKATTSAGTSRRTSGLRLQFQRNSA